MQKIITLIFFILISVTLQAQNTYYNVRLTNFEGYTKYVMIKYTNNKGKSLNREVVLRKNQDFRLKVYDNTFFLYSVSFHRGGKVRAGIHGKDGTGFFRKNIRGKTAYYQKIDCYMQTHGFFKTVHLGV